jgi:SAM-dependent methyltransferase
VVVAPETKAKHMGERGTPYVGYHGRKPPKEIKKTLLNGEMVEPCTSSGDVSATPTPSEVFNGLYSKKYFKHSGRFQFYQPRIDGIVAKVMESNPKKVLDVGCGRCAVVKALREVGVDAIGIDKATTLIDAFHLDQFMTLGDATKLPFDDQSFDVVLSTDFLEHIEEAELDKVISEMKRVGKRVVASVASEDNLNARQALYHLTNKPMSWWENKLKGIEIFHALSFKDAESTN